MNSETQPANPAQPCRGPVSLLCCPWCGVLPQIKKGWIMGWDVKCLKCGAWPTKRKSCNTAEEAVEIWNNQHSTTARTSGRPDNPKDRYA